ncbi:MFS transporter [Flexivirga meconopsidis]|uniref:MFS transporter n=1 Tax=Flexivirga meconopsidis TaxID=2977121 RepID=UPI00223F268B|nr:MFS transporter [Flexivirga meconopsidis]
MSVRLSRPGGFVVAGLTMVGMMAAAAAPSPLYPIYQQLWGFSAFTLTVIFAVYVVALLATLLTVGSLPDHVGRRPILIGGMVLLAIGMLLFVHASGTASLLLARIVQGVATGAMTGAVSALIVDLAPSPQRGSMVSTGAPSFGLGVGAALAGALVEYAPWPRYLVYWVLLAAYAVLAIALLYVPEERDAPRPPMTVLLRSLRPSLGIAPQTRPVLAGLVPAFVATWALGGLYLSLGSSVLAKLLGVTNHFVVGLVLAGFFVPAAFSLLVAGRIRAPHRRAVGLTLLGGGVAITVIGVLAASLPVYLAGSLVAGAGFGITFLVAMGAIVAATPPHSRAQTFATVFVLNYTAFSVPAVLAGLAVQVWGLRPTLVGYGALEVVLVLLAAALAVRQHEGHGV